MDISIIYFADNSQIGKLNNAVNALNTIQDFYTFSLKRNRQSEICITRQVDWQVFRSTQLPARNSHVIYITEKEFTDNWFSHEEAQFAVLSINGWDDLFARIPIELYMIYQIAQAALNFSARLSERRALDMTHQDTRGCMFDQCTDKRHIVCGMAKGIICDDCKRHLQQTPLSDDALIAVQQMLDHVSSSIENI